MTNAFAIVMQANSSQRRRLREEMLGGNFLDRASLNRLLVDVANTTLESVARDRPLVDQLEEALRWLSDRRLIGKFCSALVAEWPDRAKFLTELFAAILPEDGGVESGPLRDYMHLVDRIDQETAFTEAVCKIPENDLAPPFVVMISGVFEDEVNLMLERIVKQSMLVFYPPQKRVPYALEMAPSISGTGLLRQLATRVLGQASPRESAEGLLTKVKERIAGQIFQMRLRSSAVTPDTAKVFEEFFGFWSRFGNHALPPFLFLLVVHDEQPSAAAPIVSPADWYDMIHGACAAHGPALTLINHLQLAECQSDDISNWIDILSAQNADVDFADLLNRARKVFDQSPLVTEQRPFRLRKIKTILDEHL